MYPTGDSQGHVASRGDWRLMAGAVLCAAGVLLIFVGAMLARDTATPPPEPRPEALVAPSIDEQVPAAIRLLPRSQPTRLAIPRISLDTAVSTVGRTSDGAIASPDADSAATAAWYGVGFSPGERGTAIIVGHVNTRHGPGIFYHLSTLRAGDTIEVVRADGTVVAFSVDAVRQYPKAAFPSREVFDSRGRAGLVLITCGGTFTPGSGYNSNTVIFAHMTKTSR